MGKVRYIIIDKEIEEGFIVGDQRIAGAIIGRSHRTLERWFNKRRYVDMGRFIILKYPIDARQKRDNKHLEEYYKKLKQKKW